MCRFIGQAARRRGSHFSGYDLHQWSISEPEVFWSELWDFAGVIGERGESVLAHGDRMPGAK